MKIVSLQISNILSFKFVEDIAAAEEIRFDDDLNIFIGENGSGKSTVLEIINFLFRRVLFKQYNVNQDLFTQRTTLNADQRHQTFIAVNHNSYSGFRLEPNWNAEDRPQRIRIVLFLDELDRENIQRLLDVRDALGAWVAPYTNKAMTPLNAHRDTYTIDIAMTGANKTFAVNPVGFAPDFGYEYLTEYNFFKEAIALYNVANPDNPIQTLHESYTLIGSFRNYHSFNASISLQGNHPVKQINQIRAADFTRSMNASENSEPSVFALVRLRVAEEFFKLIQQKRDLAECETAANALPFIGDINVRLKIINLVCKIKVIDLLSWQFSFEFHDLRKNRIIADINSLSAGQKAITHLVFEAYGRGDLKGGVVIIDEPEIHLHYQFQHEYLEVIRLLNTTQKCQYVLVTHSESLINSSTIGSVRRFALDETGSSFSRRPQLTVDQKVLIRVLDNTRSTYAFFSKKVVLVEGDSDRYFLRAVFQRLHRKLDQEVAILHIGGKGEFLQWTQLFEAFGLTVYRFADLDYAYSFYPPGPRERLDNPAAVARFKAAHPDWEARILAEYANKTYVLKNGDLEHYLQIRKDLTHVIGFCANDLVAYLGAPGTQESQEVTGIVGRIAA